MRRLLGRKGTGRRPLVAALLVPLGVGAVASCTVAFDYPWTEAEASTESCSDGTDNDFDGTIDCDDVSCDGYCIEQGAASCADGRDNDGDGFIDRTDPRCWIDASPQVERCAASDGVRFEEAFDATLSSTRWFDFGLLPDTGARVGELQAPVGRPERADKVLGVTPDAPSGGVIGGLGSVELFDGDWSRFELSFRARLDEDGFARVALVPAALAPAGQAPGTTAEDSSVLIELDASREPPAALLLSGRRFDIPWGAADRWHHVRLEAAGNQLRLSVDAAYEIQVPRPDMGSARLVLWAKAVPKSGVQRAVQLDDLLLDLEGSKRCASAAPQIPLGSSCRFDPTKLTDDVGFSVALAGGKGQPLCAVVTDAPAGQVRATGAQSWTSAQGAAWSFGGTLPLGTTGEVVGAAVAWDRDAEQYLAVVGERDGDDLKLRVTHSDDCASWSAPSDGALLPADAEAPSLLVPGLSDPYEAYVTRAPTDERGRTLWRLGSTDGRNFAMDPSAVTELASELGTTAPVRLSRIGSKDIGLVYPISPATGVAGLGLAISMDETLTDWQRIERFPLLPWSPAHVGFDGEAIVSGALYYDGGSGFVLYGARGTPLPFAGVGHTRSPLTTGTAWLGAPGTAPPVASDGTDEPECGDGSCDESESCEGCAVDCGVCEGELVLADRFLSLKDWQAFAPYEAEPRASKYVLSSAQAARIVPSGWGFMVRELPWPVEGDFELELDVHIVAPHADGSESRCTAYVGVGQAPATHELSPDGIFAAIDQQLSCAPGAPAFSTKVNAGRHELSSVVQADAAEGSASCAGAVVGRAEQWHHVILRRESGRASVRVIGADGCELSPVGNTSVAYVGAVSSLDSLLIGFGGTFGRDGWTTGCEEGTASARVDNVVLRMLPCSQGRTPCDTADGERSVCVDLDSSPEHCGDCQQQVGEAEVCNAGVAWCAGQLCPDAEGDGEICADLTTDPLHCGACGRQVGPLEACMKGIPTPKPVLLPDGFYVDATEVTRGQYAAWLDTQPSSEEQHPECVDWNSSFEPTCGWPADAQPNLPVSCVDWCDAYAYCEGVGKRLCGRLGGGGSVMNVFDARKAYIDQWYNACSAGGQYLWQHGDLHDPVACNGVDNPFSPCIGLGDWLTCEIFPVASLETCQSPDSAYAGIYDLTGNVSEWIDACNDEPGASGNCRFGGGSSQHPQGPLSCESVQTWAERPYHNYFFGFRCCAL